MTDRRTEAEIAHIEALKALADNPKRKFKEVVR
jgi:hypothetical protein